MPKLLQSSIILINGFIIIKATIGVVHMNELKKSLKKRSRLIFIVMGIFLACFIFCLFFSMGSYNKSMKYYTQRYYEIASVSADLSAYNISIRNYAQFGGEFYLTTAQRDYENLKTSFKVVYKDRFHYSEDGRYTIEDSNNILTRLDDSMSRITNYKDASTIKTVYNEDIDIYVDNISADINSVLAETVDNGNHSYLSMRGGVLACEIMMIISAIAFAITFTYCVHFITKRIVHPISDIAGWSHFFNEGYSDMADLTYDVDDEIGRLVESFNIVRKNLAEANRLKDENESALIKLRNEEEYKKKFVKQLYDEKREKDEISIQARRDGLTGLYNRRSFDNIVNDFVIKRPGGTEGALFLIDMDYFKTVNDTLGHLAGDEALKTLAGAMRIVFPGAYLGRYGGDEFIAFVIGSPTADECAAYGAELCKKMDRTLSFEGKTTKLSVSVGIADTTGVIDYSELYMKVDKALYYSKEHGRNQYTLASDIII